MKKIKLYKQSVPNECGICCCKMVLNFHGIYTEYKDLRNAIGSIRDGTSIFQMKSLFENAGLSAKIFRVSSPQILQKVKRLKRASILFWDEKHFVVFDRVDKDKIFILDPIKGKLVLSHEEFLEHFSNIYLCTKDLDKGGEKKKRSFLRTWKLFIGILVKQKTNIFLYFIITSIAYILTIANAEYTKKVINSISTEGAMSKIIWPFVCLAISFVIIYSIKEWVSNKISIEAEREITSSTLFKAINLPYNFFEIRTTGELFTSLASINLLKEFWVNKCFLLVFNFGLSIILIGYLASISKIMAMVVLLITLLNHGINSILKEKLSILSSEEFNLQSTSNNIQIETLSTMSLTKVLRLEEEIYSRWSWNFEKLIEVKQNKKNLLSILSVCTLFFSTYTPILILVSGVYFAINESLNIGEIVLMQTYSLTIMNMVGSIIQIYQEYVVNSSFIDKINDLIDQEEENDGIKEVNHFESVSLKNLDFCYNNLEKKALNNVSLEIKCGQKIALVGPTGSGKSTLGKILAGLYRNKGMQVYYNGLALNDINKKAMAKQIGYVAQDMSFIADSIYENIRCYRQEYDLTKVIKAAEAACISEEINNFPMKYNTVLSDGGENISGGQRQRLLIARALLSNPSLLIFDEGTSYLDNITEKKVMDNILKADCSIVIVAHRLETLTDCDQIIYMDNGTILEQGTHHELMDKEGKYYDLYTRKRKKRIS
ncbi:peptidase domain-containing ABC transporter [Enterococcus durans]|uniref:peptidase domain-containing ABC transporter n=1 Tax=Enterococcus durans TaxID=53345 RepID=UPI00103940CD|nr:peptidase domain-containing ABC transporter [Enterococcus durans]TBX29908.1 peptidase domain-containing ABC transporter [Enterococcus durans]